jgi:hypothetical protein
MFTRKTGYVWIGILALSCMFLIGQKSWFDPCVTDPPGCVYGTCVTGVGTCDCYAGYEGDTCDTLMDVEPCGDPCVPYNEIQTGQLNPTGCETYIGAHPVHPGELLCCSDPTPPKVAPECNPGIDTPDIPCATARYRISRAHDQYERIMVR